MESSETRVVQNSTAQFLKSEIEFRMGFKGDEQTIVVIEADVSGLVRPTLRLMTGQWRSSICAFGLWPS